jgi:hypothetical protein
MNRSGRTRTAPSLAIWRWRSQAQRGSYRSPTAGEGEIQAVVCRIREHALGLLREQIAVAFGDDPRGRVTDQLARFALAAIDGAFVACQADRGATLEQLLQPLAASLVAARRALLAAS